MQAPEGLARRTGSMSTVSTNWGAPAAAGCMERQCASEGSAPKRELHDRHSGPSELQRNSAPTLEPMRLGFAQLLGCVILGWRGGANAASLGHRALKGQLHW